MVTLPAGRARLRALRARACSRRWPNLVKALKHQTALRLVVPRVRVGMVCLDAIVRLVAFLNIGATHKYRGI